MKLTWDQVLAWRMRRQGLDPRGEMGAGDVVRRLCGVQAQVASAAELGVAVRQADPRAGEVERGLAGRALLKTWAMRGTLYLLPPEEAGAYLALVAAARSWEKPSWQRSFGVSTADMAALAEAVADALDGRVLSREELVNEVVARTGQDRLEEQLRSGWGALRGWFAALEDVVAVEIEGRRAYALAEDVDELSATPPTATARLLPGFDQYVLGPGTNAVEVIPAHRRAEVSKAAGWISPVVVSAGRVTGVWEIDGETLEVRLFEEAEEVAREPLEAEVEHIARFLGRELTLSLTSSRARGPEFPGAQQRLRESG